MILRRSCHISVMPAMLLPILITERYFLLFIKRIFICYGQEKNKVRDLLESLMLTDQFINHKERILDKLAKAPDYENAYRILEERKYVSIDYLIKSIEG